MLSEENDEIRMTNVEGMRNGEARIFAPMYAFRASGFDIVSSFVICASAFASCSPHAGHFRQRQDAAQDFFTRRVVDLVNRDGLGDIKPPRFQPA